MKNKCRDNGFTLIELIIAISVLAILTVAGMTTFYQTIRGSSRVEVQKTLDAGAQQIIGSLGRGLRESQIVSLGGADREACVAAGSAVGISLLLMDLTGVQTSYELSEGKVFFGSEPISADEVVVTNLSFTWNCQAGIFDTVVVSFDAEVMGSDGSTTVSNSYYFEETLRNTVN